MKKYLVVGNPIEHSLSPKLHNYWIKKYNIDAVYEKKKLNSDGLKELILEIRKKKFYGVNVTVPFKKEIITYLDKLSSEAESTQSVNTIYLDNDKVIGHNTDIDGFKMAIEQTKSLLANKKIFILGAGGVVPSIIYALKKMSVSQITISNRTKNKAENLKDLFNDIKIVNWGEITDFDMIINATSLGLNKNDMIDIDLSKLDKGKLFYDIIYNPKETNFLKNAKINKNYTENGKKMFIYQAALAFKIWHKIEPEINEEVNKLLD
tara:strand:+ start:4408 stop:5199 length:792 start_codon:yes stop_codon:yes gene_type:complete